MKSVHLLNKNRKSGFTLIEISMAIALVAIGLTVSVLGFTGYQSWATGNAKGQNARNLAEALIQYKGNGGSGSFTAAAYTTTTAAMTITQAQAIVDIVSTGAGLPAGTAIFPAGYKLPTGSQYPIGFIVDNAGIPSGY